MNGRSPRRLFAAVAVSTLAALPASTGQARIPEGTDAPFTFRPVTAQPVVVPYVSHGIGVDPSLFEGRTRDRRDRRLAPRLPLRARAPSTGNRLFVRPTHGTSTYGRAAGMASHGDPEAQEFVDGRSDVNPFDAH